jgi:hypothetical protein
MNDVKQEVTEKVPQRIEVLMKLLQVYTVEQLDQIAEMSLRAKDQDEMPDLVIRWKNKHPRWIGVMEWDLMARP